MDIGNITSREIIENQDAEKKTLMLQVVVDEDEDVQDVELQNQSGIDSQPPDDSRVFILEVTESYQIVIAVDDGIEPDPSIEAGEKELYASDGGSRKSKIRWKKNGELILNDGTDFAVRYNELETAFNQLQADHDTLVSEVDQLKNTVNSNVTVYASHTHDETGVATDVPNQPQAPSTIAPVASTADITPTKSETVRIP